MRLSRVIRLLVATLTVVMLLGGSASGVVAIMPTVTWTTAPLSAEAGTAEDGVSIDGNLVAWEYGSGIRVKNLATGDVRTIPDSGGSQYDPDISGDRVVYMDDGAGNDDILMYHWSTNNVTTVRATAAEEGYPRIDGNQVVWWDATNADLWGRDYDMAGFGTAVQLTNGWDNIEYDVDNGRAVFVSTAGGSTYVRQLVPLGEWVGPVHTFADTVSSLEMHGDRIAVNTDDGGTSNVVVYNIANDTVSDAANSATLDEVYPTIFHTSVAWHEQEGSANADIGYTVLGALFLNTPSFGGADNDMWPRIYGNRIGYQYWNGVNWDVRLATSNSKLQARTSGTNRYGTAAAISAAYFADATDVVLCNGLNFPDALSAAPLAKALNAPLLLTGPTSLAGETATEIARLSPHKIWIIGGPDVVSNAILSSLDASYPVVERVYGANRYETSAQVARKLETLLGPSEVFRAFFARGDAFPDALAVGPVAGAANGPVMLVQTSAVPTAIENAMRDMSITQSYVIGGSDVVSDAVYNKLRDIEIDNGGIGAIERWAGDNRYATAAEVAKKGLAYRWIDLDTVGFAIGTNFPDALGGGAALGHYGSALLLTNGTSLSGATGAFLDAHRYEIGRIDCFGGSDVLTKTVYDAILAKMY
jgi:beta propeller repeat protein